MKKLNQNGFHIVEVSAVLIVAIVIGLVVWRVISSKKEPVHSLDTSASKAAMPEQSTDQPVAWEFDGSSWHAVSGDAPACPDPLVIQPPVDLSQVESILYPGQTRGGHYKAHGGFGMKGGVQHEVHAPIDGVLSGGVRYIESGDLQYKFTFTNSCGIMYMFDHLKKLSPLFEEKVVPGMPEAKVDDTRSNWAPDKLALKTGDLIATEVGHTGNAGFDFGVYDLRQKNAASGNATFVAAHQNESSQTFYGVCWLDWFSEANNAVIAGLPSRDFKQGKTSDYCT